MSYGLRITIQHLQDEVKGCSTEVQELMCEQDEELRTMRKEVEMASQQLSETKQTSPTDYKYFKSRLSVHVARFKKVNGSLM
jgi:hypothetical protein